MMFLFSLILILAPTFLRTAPSILCCACILHEISDQQINELVLKFFSDLTNSTKESINQAYLEVVATLKLKIKGKVVEFTEMVGDQPSSLRPSPVSDEPQIEVEF